MRADCPICSKKPDFISDDRTVVRFGSFYRKSDSRTVPRFRCLSCRKCFSLATFDSCFRQKKRHKNHVLSNLLCSGVSGRKCAKILCLNRKTVARKLIFLGAQAKEELFWFNALSTKASFVQFDDLETIEHTKYKPLSVILAVESPSRRILGFQVAKMNAKGLLAEKGLKKYGRRIDERTIKRRRLFAELKSLISDHAVIRSDSNPYYSEDVRDYFPTCEYQTILSRRSSVGGQGELKKVKYDPIFSLNHTCAMLRYSLSRLIRKTWCTTKKAERLSDHLAVYALYHNQNLKRA